MQLVAFLVIWLTLGFPVSCQVHGMMSMYEMDMHKHAASTDSPCAVHDHTNMPPMTMLLSLIVSIVPDQTVCRYIVSVENFANSTVRWPLQLNANPPEQPPRSV